MSKKKRLNILAFGSLLQELGGQLTTGLAIVMWELAINLNRKYNVHVKFVATDYYFEETTIDTVQVSGWTINGLLKHSILHIFVTIKYIFVSFYFLFFFNIKFQRSLVYLLFFDKVIRNNKADIFHVHGTNYVYFHFLDICEKKNIILTIHGINGFDSNIKNFRSQRKIERIISKTQFKRIVFVTTEIKAQWLEKYGEPKCKTNVILNAYNNKYFHSNTDRIIENQKIILITVGSIIPRKGQERVILALKELNIDLFEYWIIGEGDVKYVDKLKSLVNDAKLDVNFFGVLEQKEVANKLRMSDFMILPSSSEGFGIAYVESIACGTKVILPNNLPLNKEIGILNECNSIILTDSSVESIKVCLLEISCFQKYSKMEISKTVSHLNWESISNEYYCLMAE